MPQKGTKSVKLEKKRQYRRQHSPEFKKQIVELCQIKGAVKRDIADRYDLPESILYEWIKNYKRYGSFDKAVIESTNKTIKVEFAYRYKFATLTELECLLFDYIYWYNHKRIHGSINYNTPINLREQSHRQIIYQSLLK